MKKLGRVYGINKIEGLAEEFMESVENKLRENENVKFKDLEDVININFGVYLELDKVNSEDNIYLNDKANRVVNAIVEYASPIAIQSLYYKTNYDNLSNEVNIDLMIKVGAV